MRDFALETLAWASESFSVVMPFIKAKRPCCEVGVNPLPPGERDMTHLVFEKDLAFLAFTAGFAHSELLPLRREALPRWSGLRLFVICHLESVGVVLVLSAIGDTQRL